MSELHGYSSWQWSQRSKTTSSSFLKRYSNTVAIRKISYQSSGSWLVSKHLHPVTYLQHQWHLQGRKLITLRLWTQVPLPHQPWLFQLCQNDSVIRRAIGETCVGQIPLYPVAVSSKHIEQERTGETSCWPSQPKMPKPNQRWKPRYRTEMTRCVLKSRSGFKNSGKIWWMMKFQWQRRFSRQFFSLNRFFRADIQRDVWIWVNTVFILTSPKYRNCEICQRTKIHKGPVQKTQWRSRTSSWKFWCFYYRRSQSSQWRLWISKQSSICSRGAGLGHSMDPVVSVQKQKLLSKHKGACKSSWSQIGSLKSQTLNNSLEFDKACEDLSWNHCTSTPHRPETNGIAERAVRRVKEGTSAVLLQSGLDENWWAAMECSTYLRNVQDLIWWDDSTFWATI